MDGNGLEQNRVKPIAIGRRTKRAIESEEFDYTESFCVSPRTPLLKTSMQENAWVCGDNTYGQLGVDTPNGTLTVSRPVQGSQRWSSLTFGHSHTVAITAEGKVFTWGSNAAGQLGRGAVESSNQPEEVLETSFEVDRLGVAAVGAGAAHSIVSAGEALYVWGDNSHGQLGCGATPYNGGSYLHKPTRLRWLDSAVCVTQIACGKYHTMVVTSQSSLYTWGDNSRGQLGHGDDRQRPQPAKVDNFWGIPVKQVAAGNCHSIALTTNGFLFTWGDNSHGQLGLPLNVDEAEEVHKRRSSQGKARARRSLNQMFLDQMIEMGFPKERAELALLETGNNGVEIAVEWLMGTAEEKIVHGLAEWSDSPERGATGKTALAVSTPRRVVQLKDVSWVAAGAKHTVAVCPKHVYAFGANSAGQLGLGSELDSPVPNRVRTLDAAQIIQVAAGKSHSLFLSRTGQVYATGSFAHGQFRRDPDVTIPAKHSASAASASTPSSPSSTRSANRVSEAAQHAAAVDAAAAAASAANADGSKITHYCWPVPVVLPTPAGVVRDGVRNTRPVVHSVVARGNCSAFLIRGPNEVVESEPPTLLAQLTALLQRAEADVKDGLCKPRSEAQSLKAITASIAMIFGNATAISAAFGTESGTRLDVELLDIFNMRLLDLYKAPREGAHGVVQPPRDKLAAMETAVREEMKKALSKLADNIQKNVKLLGTNERAQVLLAAIQNPCLLEHSFAKQCLPKICQSVLASPPSCQQLLIRWWSTYPGKLLEERVVRPLQSYTTQELQVTKKLTLAVMNAIKVLAKVEEANLVHMTLPPEAFYNSLISEKMDMQDHYVAWRQSQNADPRSTTGNGPFSFCSFPFLLDAKAKTRLLQVEAKMQMEQTVAESRLEALYSHYKKNRENSDSEMVAPTAKMRVRQDMQRSAREREDRESTRQPRPNAMMRHFTRLFRGTRASASSPSSSGQHAAAAPDHMAASSGRGEPATEMERRNMAKDMSHDASIKRAASLQLPPPCLCSVAESHPDMCIVRVRRNHLVEDAMDEISRQFKKDLFKPLRVHFIGEEGIDAGGVKKEFFQLLVTELLCPDYGLLSFHPESRTYWFNRWAYECLSDFKLLGLVVGLAIYNFVLLDFPLPIALYRKMCGLPVGLTDLERFQPTVGKSLRQLLEYNGPGAVEDVFCQTFAIEEDLAGSVDVVELVPGGADIPVTEENRRDFVDKYVDWVLVKSIEAQYNAFREGFMMLYKGPAITLFSPAEKERLVCGNPNLDFAALKRHAKYEGGYTAETQAVVWLWDIAENIFTMAEKRMFLKFFTGSDRSPIGGLGNLKCLIQRDGPDSHKLPTSHTCFNTLLLPEYSSHEKMLDRLRLAIMNAEGFGLE